MITDTSAARICVRLLILHRARAYAHYLRQYFLHQRLGEDRLDRFGEPFGHLALAFPVPLEPISFAAGGKSYG